MPTEINGYSPSEETALSSLIINEVDSNETFEKMKEKNLLQDNQLYLVTDELSGGGVDIPASDTEPATGNYWLDTSAEGGTYYTAGEVDSLLQNKAPAGYGLGGQSKFIPSSDDLNDIVYDGWYNFDAPPINAPLLDGVNAIGYSSMLVSNRMPSLYVTQEIFVYASWEAFNCVVRRCRINGEWKPWEWVDPPMMLNTEYRTTERYMGKPVYTKLCGPVHGTATASTALELVNQFNIQYSVQETIVECKCLIGQYSEDGTLVEVVDNETFNHSDTLHIRRTGMDNGYVRLEFLGCSGEIGFIAKIKYTKSTD